jgi:hypothetical protein
MRKALQASLSVSLKVIPDRVTTTMGFEGFTDFVELH